MNARRLILAAVVSLFSFTVSTLLAAPAALAEELCPNAAARQGPSGALPDCRAYEQVTPVDKGDSPDLFPNLGETVLGFIVNDRGYVAEDGNHFLLQGEASFEGGDAYMSSYVLSRGADGWTTTSLSPGPGVHNVEAKVFNPADLSTVGFEDLERNHVPGGPEERVMVDFAGSTGGPYSPVDTLSYAEYAEGLNQLADIGAVTSLVGASADASHVLLRSYSRSLAPGDEGQDNGTAVLYESFGGHLKLVNVETDGSLISQCGAVLGQGATYAGGSHNAVSSDGSKVFFTAPEPFAEGAPGCWDSGREPANAPQLYMRLNGSSTAEVSAPNAGVSDANGPHAAFYVGASADGSRVFFLSRSELTKDAVEAKTEAPELYEYNTEAPAGARLVRVSSGESGIAAGDVAWVGGISSDGSAVYFAAYGALAQGASSSIGSDINLYRYDTETKRTAYITAVNAGDYPGHAGEYTRNWYDTELSPFTSRGNYEPALFAFANWYVTGNGQYLLFRSALPLTGYSGSNGYGELFRYSAAENSIVCVSCAGGPPVASATFTESALDTPDAGTSRPISEDGSYVFFESRNALVSGTTDKNLHVYEWHDGKISLISSPDDPGNAFFLGSSADGGNVFFGTHAQLVPRDTDVNGDVYDARIGGGFVGVTPPQCTGTGCQGVPGAPPIFATPASVTFAGVGNFEPSAAAKTVTPKKRPAAQIGAKGLAKALKACRSRPKSKRKSCEAAARKRSRAGSKGNAEKSNRRGK
ncbi:MAG TPA: hypothetical protein VNY52_06960 [Solirubrobacteraceae bacterium]|nr:hypothetical protein [Solirubrobacteraceae bacterium]